MATATINYWVTVSFTTGSPATFNFSAQSLGGSTEGVMYTVFWKLSTDSTTGSTLTGLQGFGLGLPKGWVSMAPPAAGTLSHGVQNFNDSVGDGNQAFSYKVVVNTPNGTPVTSSDPELTLQPPG